MKTLLSTLGAVFLLFSFSPSASGAAAPLPLAEVRASCRRLAAANGLVTLIGLIAKHGILMVEFANELQLKEGVDRRTAIETSARIRLRPILMTTLAMIFGMIPLALGLGEGGEQRAPMGQAVIGGVITSSLLTLVVVPTLYRFFEEKRIEA